MFAEWIILNQFGRRNISSYQRAMLALKLESVFAKKVKENLSSGGKGWQISAKVDTNKELAKIAGLSHDTIKNVKTIEKKACSETKEQLRTQEISINQAYKEVKKEDTLSALCPHFIKKAPYIVHEALSVARTGIEPVTSGL